MPVNCDVGVSADGFSSRPNQSIDHPLGEGVAVHAWMFDTPDENADELAAITSAGAFIMGRNMFTPGRGEWDLDWTGWWGPEPPYNAPVFVLSHYPREPLVMQGGTTFTFVTGGIHDALEQARAATDNDEVAISGGAATINQFLNAGLIDELRLHIAPQILGHGDRIFDGVPPLQCELVAARSASLVTHITYRFPKS